MAKAGWYSNLIRKMRDAGMPEDEIRQAEQMGRDALPAEAMGGGEGGDGDTHIHVHLPGRETNDEVVDPAGGGGETNGGGGDTVSLADFQALCQKVDQLEKMLLGDEEDVELEDQDTQDKRRFKLRRRDALKTLDADEPPVPDREPEIMGETDLPGIEDLNERKTADSKTLEPLWQETIAAAEIIVPGYRLPTFDAKRRATLTAKQLCSLRRGVLVEAMKDASTGAVVRQFVGDAANFGRLPCDAIKVAFNATSGTLKAARNGTTVRSTTGDGAGNAPTVPTNRGMNEAAREFWKQNDHSTRH